ncbi:MAG: hypothetical protein FJ356_00780 [Thaumarchaeota archaeon]|nr:hypothetical protein [Nitrososphaerota archaeon]
MVLEKIKQLPLQEFDKFLFWLIRLHPFHTDFGKPTMRADGFVLIFKLMYFCRLELSSILELKLQNFDLQNKLIRISNDKYQKSIIFHEKLFSTFNSYLKHIDNNKKFFPVSQSTVRKYAKDAISFAGMNKTIQEIKKLPQKNTKLNEILTNIKNLNTMIDKQYSLLCKIAVYVTKLYQDGEINKDTFNKFDEFLKSYYDNPYDGKD